MRHITSIPFLFVQDEEPTYDNIRNLTYMDMVISETLRKYPLASMWVSKTEKSSLPHTITTENNSLPIPTTPTPTPPLIAYLRISLDENWKICYRLPYFHSCFYRRYFYLFLVWWPDSVRTLVRLRASISQAVCLSRPTCGHYTKTRNTGVLTQTLLIPSGEPGILYSNSIYQIITLITSLNYLIHLSSFFIGYCWDA